MITLQTIKEDAEISAMIERANRCLEALGYTDHGPRHVGYVSRVAADVLRKLGYDERRVELAAMAGWMHDVGNLICRKQHGTNGAALLFPKLRSMGMDLEEAFVICSAVGNHEEEYGRPVDDVSSALIIADKVDAHRTRVRRNKFDPTDMHDRVNYSIHQTRLTVDANQKSICFSFLMDPSSSVMEYMNIYLSRMTMCENAAQFLGCTFSLVVNGMPINNYAHVHFQSAARGEGELSGA